ncbi:MAG: 6-carboxyhexanoate--CoA ligase [Desulfuromonadales bacterium]|nr:6-carboxyhexanoate--CoA ligase [Desulfuromonadales bacterium]
MKTLYSLRMRASRGATHISGAERIVAADELVCATAELMSRAALRHGAPADEVHCIAERIDPATVQYHSFPDVTNYAAPEWRAGRQLALELLTKAGVDAKVAQAGLDLLANGPGANGANMRGAVLMDATSGQRLEPDQQRGVRVSRMDLAPQVRNQIHAELEAAGLGHHRTAEALTLSGKVLAAPGIVAELCWSDEADYITGYVADPQRGYQRITPLKALGDQRGGRVFFVAPNVEVADLIHFLERQPLLFDAIGAIQRQQG